MSRATERLLLLAAIGTALAAIQQFGPFLWPYEPPQSLSIANQAWFFVVQLLWVAAMLVTYRRNPGGPMWKLFLLYQIVGAIRIIWVIPTSLTWMLSQASIGIGSVVFVHLVLAFPSGRLSDPYDRIVVAAAYSFILVTRLAWVVVWSPRSTRSGSRRAIRMCCGPTPIVADCSDPARSSLWRRSCMRPCSGPRPSLAPRERSCSEGAVADHRRGTTAVGDHPRLASRGCGHDRRPGGPPRCPGTSARRPRGAGVPSRVPAGPASDQTGPRLDRRARPRAGPRCAARRLRGTLARVLRDPTSVLAYPAASGVGFVDPDGQTIDVPDGPVPDRGVARLERDGETLAILAYDPALDQEDPGRVSAVASMARMALENERLAAQVRAQLDEVRASRARIVEAGNAERRRIERDLHDGAQQRLVALAMRLDQAREGSAGPVPSSIETTAELLLAVREVRDLARGLHPTILTEAGLAAAVESLAERTAFPVTVTVTDDRFPPEIEAAAYYVVAEGSTNIARYAQATEARVEALADAGRLVVTVTDNGRGGADPSSGRGCADWSTVSRRSTGSSRSPVMRATGPELTATLPITR